MGAVQHIFWLAKAKHRRIIKSDIYVIVYRKKRNGG